MIEIEIFYADCPACDGSCRSDNGLPCGPCQGAGCYIDVDRIVQSMPENLRDAFIEHFKPIEGTF